MNRRTVLAAIVGAGVTGSHGIGGVRPVVGRTRMTVYLGDERDRFDLVFGTGTELDTGLVQFGPPDSSVIRHFVRFTDGIADFIEADLTVLPEGGLPEDKAHVGSSRFLRDDSQEGAAFRAGNLQFDANAFDFQLWSSGVLADKTGRSGNVLVLDEHGVGGDSASAPPPYERQVTAMEANDVFEVVPTSSGPTLTAPLSEWWDTYGEAPSSQRASHVQNPPFETMNLGIGVSSNTVDEIDIVLEEDIPITDAIEFLGQVLPADAVLEQTYFGVPSPSGPIGLRINVWTLPTVGVSAVTLLYINGDEASSSVSRILLATQIV